MLVTPCPCHLTSHFTTRLVLTSQGRKEQGNETGDRVPGLNLELRRFLPPTPGGGGGALGLWVGNRPFPTHLGWGQMSYLPGSVLSAWACPTCLGPSYLPGPVLPAWAL